MRTHRLALLAACIIGQAQPVLSQQTPFVARSASNTERMANDHYSRSHDYDLLHQRIEVGRFDWDSLSFGGRVMVTLRALRPAFDSVVLDAGALLTVTDVYTGGRSGVRDVSSPRLAFEHVRDTLVVHLAKPVALGDTVRFTISYLGRVKNGAGLTFIDADTLPPRRPRQIWSQGEDDNNHDWFPTYDFPNDKATWELIATVPKGFTAISNGSLTADLKHRDGTRTMHWRQMRPSATYLVSLIVAPLVKLPDRWRTVPVDYYVYREDSARARPLFRVTPDMIEIYSRLTGISYPWAKYAQTTVADFFGGMENVSATTLVDWLPDARAYADRPWYQHILIPHELAHQWFGDYVTTANWANMWLNEGFAEFMPGQYWGTKRGRQAEDDYYMDEYEQFMRIDGRRRMPLASLGSNNIYPKGALVLEMLKKQLGERRFWAGVHRYLADHAYGVATSDDLRQAFLDATGENLDWFWDQWVYRAGFPEFQVSANWDSTIATVTLTVAQTQRDTLPADSTGFRFETPEAFRMPLTVRVGTKTGDVTLQTALEGREQVIHVAGVHSAPTMVVFDDGNRILKRLTFDQPTTWLATQLAKDPDLWNRNWVIAQLGERKSDSEALAALLWAATSADYFLTRIQAIGALAQFTGPGVSAALLQGLADSSAQVRASAAEALGGFPTPEVLQAVRETWGHDGSDVVRGAALRTLARLDPAAARPLVRTALATTSYRDAISDAAAFAAVEMKDSTLMEAVAAVADRTNGGAFALAAFGAAGSSRALDLLGQLALSLRATARKLALQAFRFGVPAGVAKPRLSALLGQASDSATRGDIEAVLARLGQ
ncbi:MAG: M1 family aminopeptidase [Gemmatimonadota bacterium]